MDTNDEQFAQLDADIDKAKKDFWTELVSADDPDSVSKHDAFCAQVDAMRAGAVDADNRIAQLTNSTIHAMINVLIAYRRGDHEEIAQILREHQQQISLNDPT